MNPMLMPVVAAQASRVRRRTEQLPEAAGPHDRPDHLGQARARDEGNTVGSRSPQARQRSDTLLAVNRLAGDPHRRLVRPHTSSRHRAHRPGSAEGLVGLLVRTGATQPPGAWGDGTVAIYYSALWGTYWLVGGYLYLMAGRHLRRT